MAHAPMGAAQRQVCVKRRNPTQGVALKILVIIRQLDLPNNRQQRACWAEHARYGWHLTSQPSREQVDLASNDVASQRREWTVYETPDIAQPTVDRPSVLRVSPNPFISCGGPSATKSERGRTPKEAS